jgi:hypothetical protein
MTGPVVLPELDPRQYCPMNSKCRGDCQLTILGPDDSRREQG